MQTIRNLNILILAFLLILTGCFGLADDAVTEDAEGQTSGNSTTDVNNPPFIGDSSDLLNNILVTQNDTNITYDTIDYPTNGNTGLTNIYVGINHFTEITIEGQTMNFATVAFIAIDEHGLGNAMMVEIMVMTSKVTGMEQ